MGAFYRIKGTSIGINDDIIAALEASLRKSQLHPEFDLISKGGIFEFRRASVVVR